jgi:hypothetical protein
MQGFRLYFETTLEYHDELNPLLWSNGTFDAAARAALLKLAEFWREDALIPKEAVKDILVVGGNANYNYTKYSDIDLHLLVNKDMIPDCDEEILDDYLKDKKKLWGLTHDVKIYGIPVEIYAQGLNEKYGKDQGVFSLKNNKWIQKPEKTKIDVDDAIVRKKAKDLENKIRFIIDNKVDKIDVIKSFKEKLRNLRSVAVKKGGEFSVENLAYKEVRNKGLIDELQKYLDSLEDRTFSLKIGDKDKVKGG